jgi:hypothetical protein
MKTSTLLISILSAADIAAAEKFVVGPPGFAQSIGLNVTEPEHHPQLAARQAKGGGSGRTVVLKNRTPQIKGSKSVKIRYGPFTVRGGGANGGEGMIWNQPTPKIAKPCSSCMIVAMNAGLEYMDGKDANTDSLMWLHHMVLFNIGKGLTDATCRGLGLPHMIVGTSVANSERIFSSGNERTPVFFNPPWENTTNIGYPVYPADRFGLITDLMNMNPGSKTVYLVMYYDYVEGHPTNFREIKPVWFDVAQCGISEVNGRTAGSKFTVSAAPWTANFNGDILQAGGHLHDGGAAVDLVVDGRTVCTSTSVYGTDAEIMNRARAIIRGEVPPLPAGVSSGSTPAAKAAKSKGHHDIRHIMSMGICDPLVKDPKGLPVVPFKITRVKTGQRWVLKAHYDYKTHPGMKKGNTNNMQSVMGIAIMFVKTDGKRSH